ncbi:MAG: DKNYY domain-containing protein [candidate division SR1 bacterium]|nr:DKNYY domain-containing protein [candidate division SR1 bacterium]
MKKFLRIIGIVIVLAGAFLVIKTQTTRLGGTPSAEKWLASQTGNIFTLENLPYIQELTETSSGKLAEYIKNYVSEIGILAQQNQSCPQTKETFYIGDTFVCFKNAPLTYGTGFGNLGRGDLNNQTPFIIAFNKILSSIGYMSLASLDNTLNIDTYFTANPKTFQVLNYQYAKDDKEVFFYDANKDNIYPMMGVDAASFEVLASGSYFTAKDKNNVYHRDMANTGIDATSFQGMSGEYSKDKNHVYYYLNILSGADSSTFTVVTSGNQYIGKDKKDIYINGLNSKEYQQNLKELAQPDMINDDQDDTITGEAYRIKYNLPKIPDFIIASVQVNSSGTIKSTDKNILLHVTVFNIGGASVSLNKTNYLRLQCAGNPIGAYADSYLFNTSKDVTSIPGGNELPANESFSVDIKAPLDTDVLKDFNKFDGHCFLYNDNTKEINQQNNNASFSVTVKN